jgi:phage terminase small subunit
MVEKSVATSGAMDARKTAFVREYVRNGGQGRAAAVAAGYGEAGAHVRASELLRRQDVRDAIQAEMFELVDRLVPMAMGVLAEIAADPDVAERDRLKAAEGILNRGYLKITQRVEGRIEHILSPAALIAAIDEERRARMEQADNACLTIDHQPDAP